MNKITLGIIAIVVVVIVITTYLILNKNKEQYLLPPLNGNDLIKNCVRCLDGYCEDLVLVDSEFNSLSSSKVFSFVLFATDKTYNAINSVLISNEYKKGNDIEITENDEVVHFDSSSGVVQLVKGYLGWFDKYVNKQMANFKILLDSENWKDFDILHFIDTFMLDLPAPFQKENKWFVNKNKTVIDYMLNNMKNFK